MTLPISDLYESRVERDAAIITRREPIVYRDESFVAPGALSSGEVEDYERDGFLFLPNFFSAREVAILLAEVDAMANDPKLAGREEVIVEPESQAVRSIFMVHRLNKLMANLSRDARLVGIAQQILGSDVYMHQSRVNIKPEFEGKEFYWHSDFETWHIEDGMPEMRALSCSILLTDNNAVNGPLMLIPGSHSYFISCVGETPDEHYKQSLRRQEYGVPDRDSLRMLTASSGIRAIEGAAGSVVFFDCNTMHGSNSNISHHPRTNIFMVYNSVKNRLTDPHFGLKPRPECIAARDSIAALKPLHLDETFQPGPPPERAAPGPAVREQAVLFAEH